MPTTHFFIPFHNTSLSCTRYGNGQDMVLCLHGYGERGERFSMLEVNQSADFSFYCPDLPQHGQTNWTAGTDFTAADLSLLATLILEKHKTFNEKSDGRYTLLGFSLGGRVALRLYQQEPEKVKRLILLAPDGLKFNFWYWFSTRTKVGNRLFRLSTKDSRWFFVVLNFVSRFRLINPALLRFVRAHLEQPSSRVLLYQRWMALRRMNPSVHVIKKSLSMQETPTRLFYGRYDRIIPSSTGKRFLKDTGSYATLTELDCGHQLVQPANVEVIVKALQD